MARGRGIVSRFRGVQLRVPVRDEIGSAKPPIGSKNPSNRLENRFLKRSRWQEIARSSMTTG